MQDVVQSIHEASVEKPAPMVKMVDDFDKGVVRRTIHDMYRKSEVVTMPKLHAALKEKDINASLSTVVRIVKELGFRFSKKGSNRRFVSERQDIVSMRHSYLRKVRKFRQEGRHIVYLDETWLNTNHVIKGDWLDYPSTSTSVFEPHCKGHGRVVPTGKGTRLIILDAGSSQLGLIPGCGLIFESKTNSSDYHDEMNKEHFTEWFKDTLIPRLPARSVVVMDNAPYHSHLDPDSKVPNTGSRKSEVSAWLDKNNVQYDKDMVKAELLDLVKQHKPRPKYIIDELASAHGHEVLRLPPYHCELNPIEMVWSDLKGYVARRNSSYKKKDIIRLFEEAKSRFDAERWANFENHVVREFEEKLWQIDGLRDEEVSPFLIDVTEGDSDDSDIEDSFEEGEGDDNENDMDICTGFPDDTLCNICQKVRKGKKAVLFQCDMCGAWFHDKCCTKAALKENMCTRCHSILHHRNLSEPLFFPQVDAEK